jgi:hypothetical protein
MHEQFRVLETGKGLGLGILGMRFGKAIQRSNNHHVQQ